MKTGKIWCVTYYRVSTDKQGRSGLGLDAQKRIVTDYLRSRNWKLMTEFVEVESGRRANNRPQLQKALALCKKEKATLIIAKLDRLARNVHFISGLLESRIDFIAVDNPHANKLTIHLLAAFAEHEHDLISQRTKSALAVAKARGVKLGRGPELGQMNRQRADSFAEKLAPLILGIKRDGKATLAEITKEMNLRNIPTERGRQWHVPTVFYLLKRIARIQREQGKSSRSNR